MTTRMSSRREHGLKLRGRRASPGTTLLRVLRLMLVVGSLIGGLLVAGTATAQATGSAAPSVAVPAYYWPGAEWDVLLRAGSQVRYIVVNPANGPGTQSSAAFVDVVARARAKGFTVVGYVDTAYGTRTDTAAQADIVNYRAWYGINQFFFDQTPSSCVSVPYYSALQTFVKQSPNGFIVLNPGTNPGECYLAVSNMVVNFEGSEASYEGWSPASYVANYGAERFWHIVYSVGAGNGAAVLTLASGRNAGFVYLTDDSMPNPFDRLPTPSLWQVQVSPSVVGGRDPAPQSASVPAAGVRPAAPPASAPPVVLTAMASVPPPPEVPPPAALPPSLSLPSISDTPTATSPTTDTPTATSSLPTNTDGGNLNDPSPPSLAFIVAPDAIRAVTHDQKIGAGTSKFILPGSPGSQRIGVPTLADAPRGARPPSSELSAPDQRRSSPTRTSTPPRRSFSLSPKSTSVRSR